VPRRSYKANRLRARMDHADEGAYLPPCCLPSRAPRCALRCALRMPHHAYNHVLQPSWHRLDCLAIPSSSKPSRARTHIHFSLTSNVPHPPILVRCSVTIQIDGTLAFASTDTNFENYIKEWPRDKDRHVLECLHFVNATDLTITSSLEARQHLPPSLPRALQSHYTNAFPFLSLPSKHIRIR
jgi:hypothetical protein